MNTLTTRSMCILGLAALLLGFAPVGADAQHSGQPGVQPGGQHGGQPGGQHGGQPGGQHGSAPPGFRWDGRYNHNQYYPAPGHVVPAPPPGFRTVPHGGVPYYYHGGAWYRPYGYGYSVVPPPVGLVATFLPAYYTTVWFGGMPYYYANDVYYTYRQAAGGYVVVDPPAGVPERVETAPPPAGADFFMYPRNGQSAQQQARDRYECHSWAVSQTGFDPTVAQGGVAASQNAIKRQDYLRAIAACLEGHGYTVK